MPVYKDSKGKWYIKYQNKTKRGFSTKKEAEKYEAKMRLEVNQDKDEVDFNTIAIDFLKNKKSKTTYGTYSKYKTVYENKICSMFPVDKKIKDITTMTCRQFYEELENCELSTKTKNFIVTEFKAIFKHGSTYFYISNNPSISLGRFKKTYDEILKSKDKELNIWTVEEFNKFINEVDNRVYKALFIVLYYTGMRLGEALGLRWKDYKNMTFDIYKSITYKTDNKLYEEKQPKNENSIRKVTVSENIDSIIESYKQKEMNIPGFDESWYMFGRKRPLPTTSIERHKNKACEKAEINRIRIHDFRHSHASYLISKGVNIVIVSRRLGHTDINMTLKVYTHLFKNEDKEIMNLLNKSSQNLLNVSL